jgi:hypothetical protein
MVVDIDVDCNDADVLTATDSRQFELGGEFVLDPLPVFDLGNDYFCGDLVTFEFVGNGSDFDVFVRAGTRKIF